MNARQPVRAIRVLIAHDYPLLSISLQHTLAAPDIEVLLERDHGVIDIVVTRYPGMLEASRAAIVVITERGHETDVRQAIEAGARGYLLYDCSAGELLHAVRTVASGGRYFCAKAAQVLMRGMAFGALTRREGEVLRQLGDGKCNKKIAVSLGVSVGTVKTHLKSVFVKLHASSRTDVVRIATARGLLLMDREPMAL